jgi:thioesterase domain-containing protein
MRLVAAVNTGLESGLAVRAVFEAPTVRSLSQRLQANNTPAQQVAVAVETLKTGIGVPLFCIHPAGGISWPFRTLDHFLNCPIIGISQILQDKEVEPRSVRDLAKNYADRLQAAYPAGPYNILGWSFGGIVAHELGVELQRRRCVIAHLIVLDAQPSVENSVALPNEDALHVLAQKHILEEALRFYQIKGREVHEADTYEQVEELIRKQAAIEFSPYKQLLELIVKNANNNMQWYRVHEPSIFEGDMIIFAAAYDRSDRSSSLLQGWRPYVTGEIAIHDVDCTHEELLTTDSVIMYGKQLQHIISTYPTVGTYRDTTEWGSTDR